MVVVLMDYDDLAPIALLALIGVLAGLLVVGWLFPLASEVTRAYTLLGVR